MHKWAFSILLFTLDAAAQPQGRWWIGFMDGDDRAFLEVPGNPRACAERDALVKRSGAAPGTVLRSRLNSVDQVPLGNRLTFGIVDMAGRASERVMTRVVAIAREEEGRRAVLPAACWYLAEGRADARGVTAREDRLVVGVNPPRALAVRVAEGAWQSFGSLSETVGTDSRFLPGSAMPRAVRERLVERMPNADQFHVQPFDAVIDRSSGPEPLWLIGAIARGDGAADAAGTYATINLIVRAGTVAPDAPIGFQAGPSGGIGRDRTGSYVAQVVAAIDLDGDGIDELILRARHYSGGNLKVLKWDGVRYVLVHQSGYEGE